MRWAGPTVKTRLECYGCINSCTENILSTIQSTRALLDGLLAGYHWISTSNHSPEFSTLWGSNAVPTKFQAGQLEASIKILDTPISEIQAEIDLLRNAVASLESRVSRLTAIRRDYKSVSSPLRHLPAEILAEILCWTRKPRSNSRSKGPYYVSGIDICRIEEGPWYLGQVFSAWRKAIENLCPELWSSLTITVPQDDDFPLLLVFKKDMVALLERALERGRGYRLDSSFRYSVYGVISNGPEDEGYRRVRNRTQAENPPFDRSQGTPEYLDIIASAPNILLFSYHHHTVIPQSAGLQFPIVRNVSLRTLSASLGGFLSSLDLPGLTSVTLTSGCKMTKVVHADAILSPQLLSLTIEYHVWTDESSVATMSRLFHQMTETRLIGDNVHYTLVPSLKELAIIMHQVDDLPVNFLNQDFLDMVTARRMLRHESLFEILEVKVAGRSCGDVLDDLEYEVLHIHLDFDDQEEQNLVMEDYTSGFESD
ncbi:uncharacterized protein BT62DRAFT_994916 [Guyanagaster necrorhizus]|uniref:F-box domain-containing protein n=1 Tax=Guyanagaster necrorhizus TaxID=856835 RepID=A0A9P8AS06_9AGAR|nr:uncharacterized protein BT62DRAFT_994916 [Guyanagaster necrorhizus MCA 3950]KAG7445461.1 hypothetical protein BT62DRAFT_994916 [Guyanagaster necrorhizus MCA 3950]